MRPLQQQTDELDSLGARIESELRAGKLELPMLPNVAAEVLASSVDEQTDAARLAALIQRDQSLASHVLRITNSAALRGTTEIVSLQQAIARLGMVRIRELAVSVAVRGALMLRGPYQAAADEIWRTSLAAGLWAREVARATRKSVEIAYLCGLLHRIGAPVVLHRLGELAPALDGIAVQGLLARCTTPAGMALARAWALPEPVAAAIEFLATPEAAGRHADLVAAAALGAAAARHDAADPTTLDVLAAMPAAARLNLYTDDLEALLQHAPSISATLGSMVL
ncbi:MAG: HDOD domain-containing protein [Pseudomonadales bacterium]|nr:HDOD domain-containing protein [Pseudomonadales bacterium]